MLLIKEVFLKYNISKDIIIDREFIFTSIF